MTTRRSCFLPALLLALLLLAGAASAGQARRGGSGRKWGRRGGKGGPRQIARPHKFSASLPEPAPAPQQPTGFTLELAVQLAFDGQDAYDSCQAACLEALQAANSRVLAQLFKAAHPSIVQQVTGRPDTQERTLHTALHFPVHTDPIWVDNIAIVWTESAWDMWSSDVKAGLRLESIMATVTKAAPIVNTEPMKFNFSVAVTITFDSEQAFVLGTAERSTTHGIPGLWHITKNALNSLFGGQQVVITETVTLDSEALAVSFRPIVLAFPAVADIAYTNHQADVLCTDMQVLWDEHVWDTVEGVAYVQAELITPPPLPL